MPNLVALDFDPTLGKSGSGVDLRQPVVTLLYVDVGRPRGRVDDAVVVVELSTSNVVTFERRNDAFDAEIVWMLFAVFE